MYVVVSVPSDSAIVEPKYNIEMSMISTIATLNPALWPAVGAMVLPKASETEIDTEPSSPAVLVSSASPVAIQCAAEILPGIMVMLNGDAGWSGLSGLLAPKMSR